MSLFLITLGTLHSSSIIALILSLSLFLSKAAFSWDLFNSAKNRISSLDFILLLFFMSLFQLTKFFSPRKICFEIPVLAANQKPSCQKNPAFWLVDQSYATKTTTNWRVFPDKNYETLPKPDFLVKTTEFKFGICANASWPFRSTFRSLKNTIKRRRKTKQR